MNRIAYIAQPISRALATGAAAGMVLMGAPGWAENPLEPPTAPALNEARALVNGMIANPRGPYARIRWFCNDGTVQPPVAYACTERGGGRQHGEFSAQQERLAALGYAVGTVFAALSWEELWDEPHRHQRLRELALERYLIDVSDGWIMRGARTYRGHVQVEAEESAGRALLLQLLADPVWVDANYLLARESTRIIPHAGGTDDRTRDVRRLAVDLAEQVRSFEPLRVEIHTAPAPRTAARVRAWGARQLATGAALAAQLADSMDELYGERGRRTRLAAQAQRLMGQSPTKQIASDLTAVINTRESSRQRVVMLAALVKNVRNTIASPTQASTRLLLFDVMNELEAELVISANQVLENTALTRSELLAMAADLAEATFGSGLLSRGEYAQTSLIWPATGNGGRDTLPLDGYAAGIGYLRRLPQWSIGSVRHAFAEPLIRYSALDRQAAYFVDDLLRSSPLIPLAEVTRRLSRDLAQLTGVTQQVLGESGAGAFGLNTGLAVGRLVMVNDAGDHGQVDYQRSDIVMVNETESELAPVAGILTLGEGNPLSHVQLLARNFGIPNISISPAVAKSLKRLAGEDLLAAVASDGSVVLARAATLGEDIRELIAPSNNEVQSLTVPPPDLSLRRPLRLAELNATLSGRVVGPKAANLGQLNLLFPGRVAPAIAIPFGIFAEHMETGSPSLRSRLVRAYTQKGRGEITDAALTAELEAIRQGIAALTLQAPYQAALEKQMAELFGAPGSYGLFVRSDTNVEDLPQFTGAGLSETLPNIVDPDLQLTSISRVWASILSPRAIAWRSNLLTNPQEIYASVLLMKSVPSDKSGVLVTTNLAGPGPGLTLSAAWGVGGAVAGEAAESIVLLPDGSEILVSEAKVAFQRNLKPDGGLGWLAAPDGPVLTAAEKTALRALAREVAEKYTPALDEQGRPRPWDIEFGFVDGNLTLFQIRPLVERGPRLADRVVSALTRRPPPLETDQVALSAVPLTDASR